MTQWTEFSFILRPSSLGGIGVFATHDIPKDTPVFTAPFAFRKMLIKDVPAAFRKFCIYLNSEECEVPERFDHMQTGWFLNHSFEPNIKKIAPNVIVTVRDIKTDEEITIDYNCLNEPEDLKESYYMK